MVEAERLRVDKWLWHARFFKTRSLATKIVGAGSVRLNGDKISKPATVVQSGDVLTFPQGDTIRVVRLVGVGTRRGPAPEAQALYDDLTPAPEPSETKSDHPAASRSGRPTKKQRRDLDNARRSGS